MAKIILNGKEIEAPEGAPLVEVIKNQGIFISNLCYIDNLPPYAGCRTCLVEIEGALGFQLSCTTKVTEGMVVETEKPAVKSARQTVLSLILSYHSDRCLTCHRVVKCKPGDTCLRDDVVTHRCLTCSKNYRCELQTTCEMVEMAGYEPWDGDERTYYQLPQPPADQGNPFLEFDPQMCIICTRCVRACDEIRHTGAITLAGRGFSTRIAFGAGGAVDESNCDFCGACIDVCPTAALMEHPNKWAATQTERWTPTTCMQCSVGCSISLGSKKGRGVIVRPDQYSNPVSRDQLCVRGRFHYDAVKNSARLQTPLIRRNGGQDAASWDEALEFAAARLSQVREEHGPEAIGFLGSPLSSNEENYLLGKIARAIVGTNSVDSSAGPVARAASRALRAAFGSELLPADMLRLAQSKTVLAVADDLESSHNVACLRIKDAAVRNGAKVIVVSALWNELVDFAEVWLRPGPGDEVAAVSALATALDEAVGAGKGHRPVVPQQLIEPLGRAVELLAAAKGDEGAQPVSVVYALPHGDAGQAEGVTGALANITIACAGDEAPGSLFVLPQEANVWGMLDAGVSPEMLPGYRQAGEEGARKEMERLWGAPLPSSAGTPYERMLLGGPNGIRALVVAGDNPPMLSGGGDEARRALESLEFLAVIDSLPTETARMAHVALPDVSPWAKEGTTVSADRRVLCLNPATTPQGEAQQGWRTLVELGKRLSERIRPGEIRINFASADEIMDEMCRVSPLYEEATYREMDSGAQQRLDGLGPKRAARQELPAISFGDGDRGGFTLTTSRSLYMSYEGAAIRLAEADKLHREDSVKMNPADAAALGIAEGDEVVLRNGRGELRVRADLTSAVQPRMLYLPLYYDAGAVGRLLDGASRVAQVEVVGAKPLTAC